MRLFCLYFALILCAPAVADESCARIVFLDVGEGDGTLVTFSGGESLLIDTGNPRTAVRTARKIERLTGRMLSALIITHPHSDHMGGIFTIKDWFKIGATYDNGEPLSKAAKQEDIYRWYSEALSQELRSEPLAAGRRLQFGDASVLVLSPEKAAASDDWNSNSLVLRIDCGKFRALIMGDANLAAEKELLQHPEQLRASVLRTGHHGAGDATGEALLDAVAPEVAIISVNGDNVRGYPGSEVIQRLTRRKAALYRTDLHGDITVDAHRSGSYEVKPEKGSST